MNSRFVGLESDFVWDDVEKASFGGDRSAAGRYAAEQRWKGHVKGQTSIRRSLKQKLSDGPVLANGFDKAGFPKLLTNKECKEKFGETTTMVKLYFAERGLRLEVPFTEGAELSPFADTESDEFWGAVQAVDDVLNTLNIVDGKVNGVTFPMVLLRGHLDGYDATVGGSFDWFNDQINVYTKVGDEFRGTEGEMGSVTVASTVVNQTRGATLEDWGKRLVYGVTVHEFGHFLDRAILKNEYYWSEVQEVKSQQGKGDPKLDRFLDQTKGYEDAKANPNRGSDYSYFNISEKFAESWSSWFLLSKASGKVLTDLRQDFVDRGQNDVVTAVSGLIKQATIVDNFADWNINHPVFVFARAGVVSDALDKASFGGDRSAAGRYAANMRWQNNAQNKGTGFLGEPANIGVLELTRGEAMFVEDTEAVVKADMTPDNGNDGKANRPDVAAKRTALKGILAGMTDVSQEDFEAADAALGGGKIDKATVKEVLTQHLIDTWASTSNDHNPASLMIQQVVKKTFGLTDTLEMTEMGGFYDADVFTDADIEDKKAVEKLAANPALEKVLTAFVKAQYANTQAYLANKGITEVALQRGMDSPKIREALRDFRMAHFERMIENGEIELKDSYEGENRNDDIAGNIDDAEFEEAVPVGFLNARIKMRPLSSFTTKPFIADSFAMDVDDGVVFTMTVPAKQIFSMPFTGVGCLREREMVVLGGKQQAQFAENSNYDQDLDYDDMFRPSDPDRAQDF